MGAAQEASSVVKSKKVKNINKRECCDVYFCKDMDEILPVAGKCVPCERSA